MDASVFWEIIETARTRTGPVRPFHKALAYYLASHTKQGILEYQERFDQVHAALYRRDLWAAAYLIGGGCSDDSFIDFRAGLIAQGREWYERVVASPDSLADHPAMSGAAGNARDSALFYEEVNYAARRAFEQLTCGTEDFTAAWTDFRRSHGPDGRGAVDMGEDFDFDDPDQMRRRLPRLAALCLADGPRPAAGY